MQYTLHYREREFMDVYVNLPQLRAAGVDLNVDEIEAHFYRLDKMPDIHICGVVEEDNANPYVEFWYGLRGYGKKEMAFGIPIKEGQDPKEIFSAFTVNLIMNFIDWESLSEGFCLPADAFE